MASFTVTKTKGSKTLDVQVLMTESGTLASAIGHVIVEHEPMTAGASTRGLEFRVRLVDTDLGLQTGAWISVFGSEMRSPLYDYIIKPNV